MARTPPASTGSTWAADGLHRCPAPRRPNFGCIGAHGSFALQPDDELLAATGSTVTLGVDHAGVGQQGVDTELQGNALPSAFSGMSVPSFDSLEVSSPNKMMSGQSLGAAISPSSRWHSSLTATYATCYQLQLCWRE
jgi:hypothetical protein